MSGKSCASSGRSMSARSGSLRAAPPHHDLALDALYDRKRDNKSVRVLTVIIYVFCVSLAAIMLSLYYVFFWEPKDAAQRKVARTLDLQTSTTPMPTCFLPFTGGSNTTVSDVPPTPANTSLPALEPSNVTVDATDLTQHFNSTAATDLTESTPETTNFTEIDGT